MGGDALKIESGLQTLLVLLEPDGNTVFLTADNGVEEASSISLSPEQATKLGTYLINHAFPFMPTGRKNVQT